MQKIVLKYERIDVVHHLLAKLSQVNLRRFVTVPQFVVLFYAYNADKTCSYVFCFLDKDMANCLKFSLR